MVDLKMNTPNWQKNSGKLKKTKGTSKNKIKSRKLALQALLQKMLFKKR